MLDIENRLGYWYNNIEGARSREKIFIYGTALDGKTFAKFLIAKEYPLEAFIDKNATRGELLFGYPVITVDKLENRKEYAVVITAKTEVVTNQMLQELETRGFLGRVYLWESFAIDTSKNKVECSLREFVNSKPWFYYDIYESLLEKKSIREDDFLKIYDVHKGSRMPKGQNFYTEYPCNSEFGNVDERGVRHTSNQPKEFDNTIYFFGDSRFFGMGVPDGETVPSYFQRLVNQNKEKSYLVENYSVVNTTMDSTVAWIKTIDFKAGDIVFITTFTLLMNGYDEPEYFGGSGYDEYYAYLFDKLKKIQTEKNIKIFGFNLAIQKQTVTLAEKTCDKLIRIDTPPGLFSLPIKKESLLEMGNRYLAKMYDLEEVILAYHTGVNFYADLTHFSPKGCEIIAKGMFRRIFKKKPEEIDQYFEDNRKEKLYRAYMCTREWKEYRDFLHEIYVPVAGKIGAIVMNANPFTNGHRYLVEYASSMVDFLYVFVVQEDKSEIAFKDRLKMVEIGCRKWSNVKVLRSGEFIISQNTFPEYFDKYAEEVNATKDLCFFADVIAQILNISCRFVGQEPYSAVTRHYNEQMKEILPRYGLECIEIDRIDVEGEVISATKVREAIKNNDIDTLRKMVPETTYQYLKNMG